MGTAFPLADPSISGQLPGSPVTGEVPASTVRGLNRALRTTLTYSVRLSDATFESHDMCCSEMGW